MACSIHVGSALNDMRVCAGAGTLVTGRLVETKPRMEFSRPGGCTEAERARLTNVLDVVLEMPDGTRRRRSIADRAPGSACGRTDAEAFARLVGRMFPNGTQEPMRQDLTLGYREPRVECGAIAQKSRERVRRISSAGAMRPFVRRVFVKQADSWR